MNLIVTEIKHDNEYMPAWYYGYAYRDILRDCDVYAVMPLNWLIRIGRYAAWRWNFFRSRRDEYHIVKLKEIAYIKAEYYDKGYAEGEACAKRYYEEHIEAMMKKAYAAGNSEGQKEMIQYFKDEMMRRNGQ